jgi:hypothetical protein
MINLVSIYVGGILTLFMALFHIRFPKLFKWEKDYGRITEINKKIFHTIHLALLLIFVLIGFLSLFYANELSESKGISFGLNLMISSFWLWRTIWQIYYFKGKTMHYILIGIFSILFLAYFIPIMQNVI